MPSPKTLDQNRAEFAWNAIQDVSKNGGIGKYRDSIRKFPSMIKTNGLGHALAFMKEKNKPLYEHIQTWLGPEGMSAPVYTENTDLLHQIGAGTGMQLRRATLEIEALSIWLKRFAESKEQAEQQNKNVAQDTTEAPVDEAAP
jgi:CRISPR-associated protein Cmr5